MVDLKTAIEELNTGMICFSSPTPIGVTTHLTFAQQKAK